MKIKNIIFDVGNVIVRWSPLFIIESTFPEHEPHQHQLFIDDHSPNISAASSLGLHTILFSDSTACLQELNLLGIKIYD